MEIISLIPIAVSYMHHVAVAALASRKHHAPASDGLHRRPGRRSIVSAQVRADCLQNGMKSRLAERRGHRSSEFQRRAQKHFLQRFSIRGVVSRPAIEIMKKQRLIFS